MALRRLIDADDRVALRAALTAGSGLPGPRANLTLMTAFAELAPPDLVLELAPDPDEYLRCCGTVGLGRLLAEGAAPDDLLRERAADGSWRVREAAAMAVQRVGDTAPGRLRTLVSAWVVDDDPLVRRAAVAGICEPRLLRDPVTAAAALDACLSATRSLLATPAADRRAPAVRTLRQALGYCWSVAVAAEPGRGLPLWLDLRGGPDPDLRWIVRENQKKTRLARILPAATP